ncbi:hypothetical protein T440DRAFT_62928 [Plenodomus tracheiphilus IPT5]|uniref:RING-type domain-containing protein n=1 Tax=Plenodomus tracheiphilus IPT5 TaxID=1408161 RepID=A0A6A7B9K1_9PLEO|nr:hypothetical protein T440DRAFT_62928 [Plenodomus tracheiphilus IPT5]
MAEPPNPSAEPSAESASNLSLHPTQSTTNMPGLRARLALRLHHTARKYRYQKLFLVGTVPSTASNAGDEALVQQACPGYFATMSTVLSQLPPNQYGRVYSGLRHTIFYLTVYLVSADDPEELPQYLEYSYEYIDSAYPYFPAPTQDLHLDEVANVLNGMITAARVSNPHLATAGLPPSEDEELDDEGETRQALQLATIVGQRFGRAVFLAHRQMFRNRLSWWDHFQLSRGFRQEDFSRPTMRWSINRREVPDIALPEDDYQPTGERIPFPEFCEPAADADIPAGTSCSVCLVDAVDAEEGPVRTKCGHFFHSVCLDAWVNESGQRTANTCPTCREELCHARPRVHVSVPLADEAEAPVTVDVAEE